jgi:glycosyltransferase involved in cell wall biosynthesis
MKILLVCESVYKNASGGKVIRYLSEILKKNGDVVKIIVLDGRKEDDKDDFYKNHDIVYLGKMKGYRSKIRHVFPTSYTKHFLKVIKEFNPDVTHFASYKFSTPAIIIDIAISNSKKVVLQPWIYDFFCHQGYAFRDGQPCDKCATNGFFESINKGCASFISLPNILNRYILNLRMKEDIYFLSSNNYLDNILQNFGVKKEMIFRFPIPFKVRNRINPSSEGGYFMFYGQAKDFKGIEAIIEPFIKMNDIELKIFPFDDFSIKEKHNNIEVVNNLSWNNGLEKAISGAKAILIPSLWPTTTEYTLYEAMSFEKPIIAFNVGAHKELLEHKYNAMLSEVGDQEKFVENIKEINNNEILRKNIVKNASKTLIQLNDDKVLHNKLSDVYST